MNNPARVTPMMTASCGQVYCASVPVASPRKKQNTRCVQNTSKDARPSVASRRPNQVSANGDPYFTSRMPMATASICRRIPSLHLFTRASNNTGPVSTSKAVCRQTDRAAAIAALDRTTHLGIRNLKKSEAASELPRYKPAVHRNCHPNKSNAPVSLSGIGNPKCAAA